METFAGLSGLYTNRTTSLIINLTSRGSTLPFDTHDLTLLAADESCRYLGVMMGQGDAAAENWTKCIGLMVSPCIGQGEDSRGRAASSPSTCDRSA